MTCHLFNMADSDSLGLEIIDEILEDIHVGWRDLVEGDGCVTARRETRLSGVGIEAVELVPSSSHTEQAAHFWS